MRHILMQLLHITLFSMVLVCQNKWRILEWDLTSVVLVWWFKDLEMSLWIIFHCVSRQSNLPIGVLLGAVRKTLKWHSQGDKIWPYFTRQWVQKTPEICTHPCCVSRADNTRKIHPLTGKTFKIGILGNAWYKTKKVQFCSKPKVLSILRRVAFYYGGHGMLVSIVISK